MNKQTKESEDRQARILDFWAATSAEHKAYHKAHPDKKPTAKELAELWAYQDMIYAFINARMGRK